LYIVRAFKQATDSENLQKESVFEDGAFLYRGIFALIMTIGKKQNLARAIGIQKENCG